MELEEIVDEEVLVVGDRSKIRNSSRCEDSNDSDTVDV